MEFFLEHVIEFVSGLLTLFASTALGIVAYKSKKKVDAAMDNAKRAQDEAAAEEKKAKDEAEEKAKKQREDYERLLKDEQNRNYRDMIVNEIEPLVQEIHRVKKDAKAQIQAVEAHLKLDEDEFEQRLENLKSHHNTDKTLVDEKLADLAQKHEDNLSKILESYKFRFIQLCKTHLKDGYITPEEWDQIVAFYDIYHGLGGNGQAEEYFEQVKKLVGNKIPD